MIALAAGSARSTYTVGRPDWVDLLTLSAMTLCALSFLGCLLFVVFAWPDAVALRVGAFGAIDLMAASTSWDWL